MHGVLCRQLPQAIVNYKLKFFHFYSKIPTCQIPCYIFSLNSFKNANWRNSNFFDGIICSDPGFQCNHVLQVLSSRYIFLRCLNLFLIYTFQLSNHQKLLHVIIERLCILSHEIYCDYSYQREHPNFELF